jgi:hypothetical protein
MMKKILLFLMIFSPIVLAAATVTWTGATDSDWNTAGNWNPGIPTAADDVVIDDGTVVLSGTATVQRVYVTGSSDLTINLGSTLTVDGFTGNDDGLEVNNSASVNNNGAIIVRNINAVGANLADGIYVRGMFTNNGTIDISNTGEHGLFIQRGNFTNTAMGVITIGTSGQVEGDADNIYVDDSGVVLGLLTNNGMITLTTMAGADDGIYVNDGSTFDNNATVSISGAGKNGIRVDDRATFNNNAGANFSVDGGTDDQIFVDNTGAEFVNDGTVTLTNCDAGDAALYVTDNGKFTNTVNGMVNISTFENYGIQIDANANAAPATIENFGGITVTGGVNDGLRIQENGIFNNQLGGVLSFVSSGDEAIELNSSNPGNDNVFNNSGTVNISDATNHGMEIIDGTFNNLTGGLVMSNNCGMDGIRMQDIGLFNNDGDIRIDNSGSEDIETETVTSFINTANATFAPGSSPGDLEIRDDMDLGTSTTTFEITGLTATTEYDQIISTVTANTLTISSAKAHLDWGSFVPSQGDCFKVVDGSGLVGGEFATVTSSNAAIVYTVDYSSGTEVEVCVDAILSVELVRFTGEENDRESELNWETASELDNDYFVVEHSTNGSDFSMLERVEGAGTSTVANNYKYVHKNPESGDNFYRLKQVDFNGAFEYSNIVLIQIGAYQASASIYPNPAHDVLTFEGDAATLTFYDIYGKQVMQQTTTEEFYSLDVSKLKVGVYMIEVSNAANEKVFKRFIKK